jgi:hypothetical protein
MPSAQFALRYALQPVLPCGPGHTAKSQALVEYPYEQAIPFLRAVYPLLTRHVLHTDRVFMNRSNVLGHLLAGAGGGMLMEGYPLRPAVRWRIRTPGSDVSVSTNRLAADGTEWGALVLNAGPGDVDVELLLDDGLVPGRYRVEHGAATTSCDALPAGTPTTAVTVHKRGAGAPVDLVLPPGLRLLTVVREAPPDAPAAAHDLALDPPRFRLTRAPLGPVPGGLTPAGPALLPHLRVTVRVVNAGQQASPPAGLQLYGQVLEPDGLPAAPFHETLFHSSVVPALAGATGYDLPEHRVTLDVPLQGVAATLLAQGMRLSVRARLVTDPLEHDLLNDEAVRSVALADVGVGLAKKP